MSSNSNRGNDSSGAVSPKRFSHAVLNTLHLEEMVRWYQTVLNAEVLIQNEFAAFMTYDDEHHRIALLARPGLVEREQNSAGLDHLAFAYQSLGELVATYDRLKAAGITPHRSINHGVTTSFYYRDPDGNGVELLIDNVEPEQWKAWMRNYVMPKDNPYGLPIDPDDIARKYHSGIPESEIKRGTI